jgi:hypothetical protein
MAEAWHLPSKHDAQSSNPTTAKVILTISVTVVGVVDVEK